jgi:uncharacterized membrane protein YeiH
LSAEGMLIGEEIYAAEAYLGSVPSAQARLLTHDALRSVVILTIVVLIVVRLVLDAAGINLALPFSF